MIHRLTVFRGLGSTLSELYLAVARPSMEAMARVAGNSSELLIA